MKCCKIGGKILFTFVFQTSFKIQCHGEPISAAGCGGEHELAGPAGGGEPQEVQVAGDCLLLLPRPLHPHPPLTNYIRSFPGFFLNFYLCFGV